MFVRTSLNDKRSGHLHVPGRAPDRAHERENPLLVGSERNGIDVAGLDAAYTGDKSTSVTAPFCLFIPRNTFIAVLPGIGLVQRCVLQIAVVGFFRAGINIGLEIFTGIANSSHCRHLLSV